MRLDLWQALIVRSVPAFLMAIAGVFYPGCDRY